MPTVSLFLGLPCDIFYNTFIEKMDSSLRELYISDRPESYLNTTHYNGIFYLGKFLGEMAYISDLELLEKNIYSILHKIIPNHPHETKKLEVLIIPSN